MILLLKMSNYQPVIGIKLASLLKLPKQKKLPARKERLTKMMQQLEKRIEDKDKQIALLEQQVALLTAQLQAAPQTKPQK